MKKHPLLYFNFIKLVYFQLNTTLGEKNDVIRKNEKRFTSWRKDDTEKSFHIRVKVGAVYSNQLFRFIDNNYSTEYYFYSIDTNIWLMYL